MDEEEELFEYFSQSIIDVLGKLWMVVRDLISQLIIQSNGGKIL